MSDEQTSRWHTHQPNVTGRGIIASYSAKFWAITIGLGAITGAAAAALIGLLDVVEHLAYGHRRSFLASVRSAADWRHFAALLAAAVIVIVGLRVLRRLPMSGGTEVSESLWLRRGQMAFRASIARAVLSIVTVALGSALGREGAPQLVGAATASKLSDWADLPVWQRRLLVASGAGAGFAAVYNVPLGGTLFALEVLLGTISLALVLPALLTSVTATAVAWIFLGTGPSYDVPTYAMHASLLLYAALMGPVIGLASVGWVRLIAIASRVRPKPGTRQRWIAPLAVFAALAALSIPYPQLLGNGKDIVQLAVVGRVSLGLLVVLSLLRPLATAACLGSGTPGGLFTPTFAVGVLFTGAAASIYSHIWSGAPLGSYALIGGGAFLAASMQGPLSGTVLVLELSRHFDALMVPTLLAVSVATIIARRLGAQSIYSARLADPGETDPKAGISELIPGFDDADPE